MFKIIIDKKSFYLSKSNHIIGLIYIETTEDNSIIFPGRGWTDFVDVIAGWWANNYISLLEPNESILKNYFMDGPYFFTLKTQDRSSFKIEFFKDEELVASSSVEKIEMRNELLRVSKEIIKYCETNNITTKEIKILKQVSKQLNTSPQAYKP